MTDADPIVILREGTEGFSTAAYAEELREWCHFQSSELAGSTVTTVGTGAIGTALLRRLDGFDVETVGVRYTPQKGGRPTG